MPHKFHHFLLIFLLFSFVSNYSARRRTGSASRSFDDKDKEDRDKFDFNSAPGAIEEEQEEEKSTVAYTVGSTVGSTVATTEETTTTVKKEEEDVVEKLLEGVFDLENLTKIVEEEHADALDEATNRTVFWIDTSYKALDFNLTVDEIEECIVWQKYWNATMEEKTSQNSTNETDGNLEKILIDELKENLKETELVKSKKRLKQLGLNPELLVAYKAVGLVYREICGNHGRTLWFRSREDAARIGVDSFSPICEPFKEELNPDEKTLSKLALRLNILIQNVTEGIRAPLKRGGENGTEEFFVKTVTNATEAPKDTIELLPSTMDDISEIVTSSESFDIQSFNESEVSMNDSMEAANDSMDGTVPTVPTVPTTTTMTTTIEPSEEVEIYDDDEWDYRDMHKRFKVQHQMVFDGNEITETRKVRSVILKTRKRVKRDVGSDEKEEESDNGENESEDDWLNVRQIIKTEDGETTVAIIEETNHMLNGNQTDVRAWIEIDASDAINPALFISSPEAVSALGLEIEPSSFQRFENVGLFLPGICSEYVPKAIDEFNSSSFEGVEIEGPIGVNITALELAGVNLTALAEKLRNDTEVDEILSRTNGSTKNLGGSFILPVLNKNQYDPFSAPIVFQGSAVVVRFGIYIESMSNFQTSTMDYDMDIYLMMSWRDARLVNPYDKPILVKEEDILEKIWRPDPFFANAKEAEFHEVTFLNFLMRIFPDGLVLYETRVKIKPSCNLILCKYPHDKQTCDLLIKSFAYPVETVRFEWFTRRKDAIDKNPDVKLPELYIDRYETTTCPNARKSGDFSCLRAVFRLKRDVGFHIAQTYIPTSLALMFSWVGVWLPEEFMEGRIGVAITVLLTLSTESAGAREHLPSVSYLKAIDLWFGFITGFVFFTLLQTLFVIGFDKRANQLRKWASRKSADMTEEVREALLQKATRYHKTGRYLDNFCRVFYPLSFILFLFMYYFVFTEGRQDDCMNRR